MRLQLPARKIAVTLFIVAIIAACIPRFIKLDRPLLDNQGFRQTQTANTVYWFLQEGVDFLHYPHPVMGPDWSVPFEFPAFQVLAYGIAKAQLFNLDLSCRITALLCFGISAWLLYACCALIFNEKWLSRIILLIYLWLPYTIFWSRACMIDYLSAALSLAYLYFFLRWLRHKQEITSLVAAVILGILAYLTKLTTVPAYVIIAGCVALVHLPERLRQRNYKSWLVLLVVLVLLPMLPTVLWTKHADSVKAASPLTSWLTSENLQAWNFGTLSQRLDAKALNQLSRWLFKLCLPGLLSIVCLPGVFAVKRMQPKENALYLGALIGIITTIATFFNLYVHHDYYLIALTPLLALVCGVGVYQVLCVWLDKKLAAQVIVALALLLSVLLAVPYSNQLYKPIKSKSAIIGRRIAEHTTPDTLVAVEHNDWNPEILYYAKRKGLMLRDPALAEDYIRTMHDAGFTCLLTKNKDSRYLAGLKNPTLRTRIGRYYFFINDVEELPSHQ